MAEAMLHVEAEAMVASLPHTEAKVEADAIGGTLRDLEAEALVDTRPNSFGETMGYVEV